MPTSVLSLLTAGVVVAHLLLLLSTSNSLQTMKRAAPTDARPFSTRSIALGPAQPTSVAPPPTPITSVTPSPVAKTVAAAPAPRPSKAKPERSAGSTSSTASVANNDITTIGPANTAVSDLPAAAAAVAVEPAATFENVTTEATRVAQAATAASAAKAASAAAASEVALTQPSQAAAKTSVPPANTPSANSPPANAQPPSTVSTAYTVPGSTRLKYNVIATKGPLSFNARAELLWLQDGSTYDARLEVTAFLLGARIQTSTGRLSAEGLEPKRFADKFRSEVAAHFERDKRLVTFSANTPQVPLLAGMQDQLSVVMQLSAMIAGAPGQYPSGTAIAFDTIGPRSSEKWVLTVGEEEKLALPGGELQTLKLTRKPRGEYDQTLELWLAPQLGYLPARIKLTEKNGDYADQVWRATETP
jgi:hypothetical protein